MFHIPDTAPAAAPQTAALVDSSARNGLPSVKNYIRKIFLVSDNDTGLVEVGLQNSRLLHRVGVGGFDQETHRWLNAVRFQNPGGQEQFLPARRDTFYRALPQVQGQVGEKGFVGPQGKLQHRPFDFGHKNNYSLLDLHGTLARIVLPESFPENERLKLETEDYELLRNAMSQRPREREFPGYDKPDNYVKFWIFGNQPEEKIFPKELRTLNKIGWACGYLTDAAYIKDAASGAEFILVGTIHVNKNKIFNNGIYEFQSNGLLFFWALGRAILRHESLKTGGE